jgi:LysR family hydrogen peroxide-inducible transcriptional activator
VSQPSLSAQLAQLEGALGVACSSATPARAADPAGEELIERCARAAGRRGRSRRRRPPPGRSAWRHAVDRCHPTISPYLLPAAAPPFRRAHPRLTVRWL